MSQSQHKLIKQPAVLQLTAQAKSTLHVNIKRGLIPAAVKIGGRSVAYIESEILAVNAARIAGKSDDEIRQLVARMMADRKKIDVQGAA